MAVTEGEVATFSVAANGTAPLSYQWRRGAFDVVGATGATYSFTPGLADTGSTFSVVVTNAAGSVTSVQATLTVNAAPAEPVAPSIEAHPASVTAGVGQTVTFTVVAFGTTPLGYQWRRNGVDIPDATGPSYQRAALAEDNDAAFDVVVTNAVGSVTSDAAILTVTSQTGANELGDIVAISAGAQHSLALRADGTVLAWGNNEDGELGIGDLLPSFSARPVPVVGITDAVAIAACSFHSLAVLGDGTVRAWGQNLYGKVGIAPQVALWVTTPAQVEGLTDVIDVACGEHTSFAIKSDGTLWAWGYNGLGQLGDGTELHRTAPVQVSGLTNVVDVASSRVHTLALRSDGTVWAWGDSGYVGRGWAYQQQTPHTLVPAQVPGIQSATGIAAAGTHSLVRHADGTVSAWGLNLNGELGDPTVFLSAVEPIVVPGLSGVSEVFAGTEYNSAAILADASVLTWGNNEYGKLGDGTTTTRGVPGTFAAGDVAAIALGYWHTLVLRSDGTVLAVGSNNKGQLGNGTQVDSLQTVTVLPP